MLRITKTKSINRSTLCLEGKLLEPWVGELLKALGPISRDPHVTLDLTKLTFVDEPSARLLRDLKARGLRVVGCSAFLAELLQLEDS